MAEPKPSVDDLVRVLTPTAIEVRPTGEAYSPFPVYNNAAAADVLRRVSKWLDAGAYDVVIGERHRELLDRRPLDQYAARQLKFYKKNYHMQWFFSSPLPPFSMLTSKIVDFTPRCECFS